MKRKKIIAIILTIVTSLTILIGCQPSIDNNNDEKNNEPLNNQNEILPKIDCITKIKKLLDCTYIYFFDCDFSEFKEVTITDVSYNISISGYIIKNKNNDEVLDLNESANIEFVTNYQIATKNNCFGFSIISQVMQSKTYRESWSNNGYEGITKTPNKIYDQFTFKSIEDITVDQIRTFGNTNNIMTRPIKVPEGFYPCDLIPNAASQIKSINQNSLFEDPVLVLTHYKSEEEKPDNETLIKSIAYYFQKNGEYIQH